MGKGKANRPHWKLRMGTIYRNPFYRSTWANFGQPRYKITSADVGSSLVLDLMAVSELLFVSATGRLKRVLYVSLEW